MEKEFLINAGPLAAAIKTLKPFISTEETRYYLNGIFFELEPDSDVLNLVATDGLKLCVLNEDIDRQELFDDNEGLKVIVPTKALDTMLAMLKGVGGTCPIALRFDEDRSTMYVDTPDEKGEFKLIEGDYPEYRKVIPTKKPKFTIGLAKSQAKEALKAAVAAHSGEDALQWRMTDEISPIVLAGDKKLVVVMPTRVSIPGEVRTDE